MVALPAKSCTTCGHDYTGRGRECGTCRVRRSRQLKRDLKRDLIADRERRLRELYIRLDGARPKIEIVGEEQRGDEAAMWIEASFPSEETLQIFLTFADEEGMDPEDLLAEWVNEALARMSNIDGAKERHAVFRSAVGVAPFQTIPLKPQKQPEPQAAA